MKVQRYSENPLITPKDVPPSRPDFEVICVFNCAVTKFEDEILLLMRVAERPIADEPMIVRVPVLTYIDPYSETELAPTIEIHEFRRDHPDIRLDDPRVVIFPDRVMLTSISHLRIARSKDGRNFTVDPTPAIFPDRPSEVFGIEDPRITKLGDVYYIVYKSVAATGITQTLASTLDFVNFKKLGVIFCPENMDAAIFPEKVQNQYVALHRPQPKMIGQPNMWIAFSNDLLHWGEHRFLMGVQPGKWDGERIGAGAIPIKTDYGWLEIYHGATSNDVYSLGAVLLDMEKPYKILARSQEPILKPEALYEMHGLMSNIVFTCGLIQDGDRLSIYYGAGDKTIAGADFSLSEILSSLGAHR